MLLPPPLVRLLLLKGRAKIRLLLRRMRRPKSAFFTLAGVAVTILYAVPAFVTGLSAPDPQPETLGVYFPGMALLMLLTYLLAMRGAQALAFPPEDIEFLFSAPFTRAQVLTYRLTAVLTGQIFIALFITVIGLRWTTTFPVALAAVLLTILFIYLISLLYALVVHILFSSMYSWVRRAVGLAVAATLILAAWAWLPGALSDPEGTGFDRILRSPLYIYATAPFIPFRNLLVSTSLFNEGLPWLAACLLVDGVLLYAVYALDRRSADVVLAASQAQQQRIERFRKTGGFTVHSSASRIRVPVPPRAGGAGTLAWRHVIRLLRIMFGSFAVVSLTVVLLAFVALYVYTRYDVADYREAAWPVAFFLGVYLTLVGSFAMRFDFRSDLDHMDWLKCLPLKPVVIAAGQVVTPVLCATAFQLLIFSVALAVNWQPGYAALVFAFAIPLNILIFGVENTLFLLYPVRLQTTPGDPHLVGRQLVVAAVKMLVIGFAVGIAGVSGALVHLVTGSLPVSAILAWIVLVPMSLSTIPAVAWAFDRFDPSVDTPI